MKENETPNQGKGTNGNVNEVQKQGLTPEELRKQKEANERELGAPEPYTKKEEPTQTPGLQNPSQQSGTTQPAKTEPAKPVAGQKERGL
jgi:hypothetical protein